MGNSESATAFQASRTVEQRRETALKRWVGRSAEQRTAIAKKICANRSESAANEKRQAIWAAKTPEEIAAIIAKRQATKAILYPKATLCSICNERPRRKDSYCAECKKEWFARRNYGLSPEQYRVVMEPGECRICRRTDLPLHIDHAHATNQIRGLLCNFCNWFVSHLDRVSDEVLDVARRYVKGEHLAMIPVTLPTHTRKPKKS